MSNILSGIFSAVRRRARHRSEWPGHHFH